MPDEIRHLRTEDRKIIHRMLKDKKSQTEIAGTLGFSQGSISKEIRRNSGKRGYRPKQAQAKADERKSSKKARSSVITEDLADRIIIRRKIGGTADDPGGIKEISPESSVSDHSG